MISLIKRRAAKVTAVRRVKSLRATASPVSIQAGNGSKEFTESFSSLPVFLSRNQKNHPVFPDFAVFDSYTQR
jgi:hypothetical protein